MTLLKWTEPLAYVRASYRHEIASNKGLRPRMAGYIALGLMALSLLSRLNPNKTPPSWGVACLIAIIAGLVFAYLVPLLYLLAPPQVMIKERKIIRAHANTARQVAVRDLLSFEFDEILGFAVVRFEVRKQAPLVCALPDPAFKDELRRVLSELRLERTGGG